MIKQEIEVLDEPYLVSKMPFVVKLFKNRFRNAIRLASISKNSVVLDAGCNRGYFLKMIQNQGVTNLCGIDISTKVLEPYFKADLSRADVRNIPFQNGSFDVVFALDMLEHLEEIDKAISEINRVLKDGGFAILSGPTESWFYSLCRLLWLGKRSYAGHKHSVYDIEKAFQDGGFQLIEKKSLPRFPLPELFRVSKFKKII